MAGNALITIEIWFVTGACLPVRIGFQLIARYDVSHLGIRVVHYLLATSLLLIVFLAFGTIPTRLAENIEDVILIGTVNTLLPVIIGLLGRTRPQTGITSESLRRHHPSHFKVIIKERTLGT